MSTTTLDGFLYKSGLEARALDVEAKLAELVKDRLVNERNLRGNVLDIGVGYGGSYAALSKYSEDVIGVEPKKELADILIESGVIAKDRLFRGNPVDFLKGQKDGTIDFIAVLHLFNNDYGFPIEDVHPGATRLLKKGGQLLYSAEKDTSYCPGFDKRLINLPHIKDTTAEFIENYPIGPDNILYIVTKH